MKAIAVIPGKADSVHLANLPKPSLDDIPRAGACSSRYCVSASTAPTGRSTPPNMARPPMVRFPGHRPREFWPGRGCRAECHGTAARRVCGGDSTPARRKYL